MLAAALLSLPLAAPAAAQPSNCRLYLAGQYDWGANTGFYMDLEGSELGALPVILGAADGNGWRFISHAPPFETDRTYRLRGVVGPEGTQLYVDDALVAESAGTWRPAPVTLDVNNRPGWANEPGDWVGIVEGITVTLSRGGEEVNRAAFDFRESAARPVPLQLFQQGQPRSQPLTVEPGDAVTIEVAVHFGAADLRRWAPFLDQYFQCRYADWPEKVRSDDDLRGDVASEEAELQALPPSAEHDQYGGYVQAGWREAATGFFRTVQRDGRWWLITPEGNPCFFTGVCAVPMATWETSPVTDREFLFEWLPPHDGPFAAAWGKNLWGVNDGTEYVCPQTCNLVRKYGDAWSDRTVEQGVRRLRSFGFSGGGKWGTPAGLTDAPVLSRWATPRLVDHPDVFDPAVCAAFAADLERQIAPRRDDPFVLGWSLGNEYDEIIKRSEIEQILRMDAQVPAKRALLQYGVEALYGGAVAEAAAAWGIQAEDLEGLSTATPKLAPEEIEALRRHYADRYYAEIYRAVKAADPNHLYLGFWIVPGWWENEEDWRLIAPHCDVIGYDRYAPEFADERLTRLAAETGKPILCGEFSFPAWNNGRLGYGHYGPAAPDGPDEEAGQRYGQWVKDAAENPYCVGTIWFEYRDQPLTGRGPGRGAVLTIGEHFPFGLVTVTDRVKWPLVRAMRDANLQAARWRLEAPAP